MFSQRKMERTRKLKKKKKKAACGLHGLFHSNQMDSRVTNISYKAKQRQIWNSCTKSHFRASSMKFAATVWEGQPWAPLLAPELSGSAQGTWLKYCWRQVTSNFKQNVLKHCETGVLHYEIAGKETAQGWAINVVSQGKLHKWFELQKGKKTTPNHTQTL